MPGSTHYARRRPNRCRELTEGDGDAIRPRPTPIAPDFTADDLSSMMQGAGLTFEIPIYFFEGTHDQHTPTELAEQYFATVVAPHKDFVRFEGCRHFFVMNRPDTFLRGFPPVSAHGYSRPATCGLLSNDLGPACKARGISASGKGAESVGSDSRSPYKGIGFPFDDVHSCPETSTSFLGPRSGPRTIEIDGYCAITAAYQAYSILGGIRECQHHSFPS